MEEGDLSSENWHVWCRLCGSLGSQQHTNVFDIIKEQERVLVEDEQEISLLEAIHVHLNMTITQNDELPKMICLHCAEVMKNFVMYHKHVHNVQKMFKAIHENELVEWHELDEVRKKFGVLEKNSVALPTLNADQDNNIMIEIIANQLSCVPMEEYTDGKMEEKQKYEHEKLNECSIEAAMYPGRKYYIIWPNDNEDVEEIGDVELSYKQNMEENTVNACQKESKNCNNDKTKHTKINVTCKQCNEQFEYYDNYRIHLIEKHNKQKDPRHWECPKCEKFFMSSNVLERHLRNHIPPNELNKFSCADCNKQYLTKESLKVHIRYKHSLERYVCEECGITVKNKTSIIKQHKLTHSKEEPFECTVCSRRFKYAPLLKTHVETHDNKKHTCNICGLKLNTRSTLRGHMKVHDDVKKFKCDLCDKAFKYKGSLKIHAVSHAGLKLYTCDICGLSFTHPSNVRRHKINMHPEKWADLKKSGNNDNLMLKTHLETLDHRKRTCNICGLILNARSTLRRHMKVHNDVKKYKCNLCDKVFKFKTSLKNHLVSHAGLKLYTCDICGLGFSHLSNCRRHKINIHPEKWAALKKSNNNEKIIHRLPTIEALEELAALNFNNGDGKKHKQNKK